MAYGVIERTSGLGLLAIKAGVADGSLGIGVVLLASKISLLAAHLFLGIFEVLEGLALETTLKEVLLSEGEALLDLRGNARVLGVAGAASVSVDFAVLHAQLLLLGGCILEAHVELLGAVSGARELAFELQIF